MTWFHPAWLDHQRRRWMLPDPSWFVAPQFDRKQCSGQRREQAAQACQRASILHGAAAVKYRLAGLRFELALVRYGLLLRKANFNPDQPRVPSGNPDGGQWTDGGGGTSGGTELSDARRKPPPPPKIPQQRPPTRTERSAAVKAVARWIADAIRNRTAIGKLLPIIEVVPWMAARLPDLISYHSPKSLEELQGRGVVAAAGLSNPPHCRANLG